jgi:NADH dehydrogenase
MHRVVIIGSGFAGLFAAKALRRAPVEVVVVDRTNHHLFQPLLYQVATGVLSEGDIAPPIRDVLRHHRNARVVVGEVVDVDIDDRKLTIGTLGRETTLPYDSLIVATGASQSYFGHDEYARHAPGMKTIDDALELRGRIFGAFELAELETDPAAREPWLTFAIVGAGPHRRRAGRADRRAVPTCTRRQLPQLQPRRGADRPARRARHGAGQLP